MKTKINVNPETDSGKTVMHGGETTEKAIQVTEDFAEKCGIHGIGHIFGKSQLRGIVWATICVSSFGKFLIFTLFH